MGDSLTVAARPTRLPGPRGLPFLGNLHQISIPRFHLTLEHWRRKYGPLYTFALGARPAVVVAEPDLVRDILRDRPEGFRRVRQLEQILRELGTHGVFSAEGDDWQRQRRLITPAFSSGATRTVWPGLRKITERLHERWQSDGASVDALSDLMRFTVDVTARLLFGRDLNTIEQGASEFHRHVEAMFASVARRVNAPFPYWRYFKLPVDRRLDRSVDHVRREVYAMIEATRRTMHGSTENASTLLEAMLQARDQERFSSDEVFGNAMTLLLAGEDTTANTLAWALYYVATHEDVQRELQAEADAVLGGNVSLARLEDTQSMRFAGCIVREALRLRSPAPLLFLEPLADVTLGGALVKKGTLTIVLTRCVEIEQLGPDGADFRPQRWLVDSRASAKSALAFGDGPRICPGRGLALIECALVLAMVGKAFDLSVAQEPAEKFNFVMQPNGLRLTLRGREK